MYSEDEICKNQIKIPWRLIYMKYSEWNGFKPFSLFQNFHVSAGYFKFGDSDIGDIVMLVTLWWWPILDVGGRIIMLATFFVMLVIFSMY